MPDRNLKLKARAQQKARDVPPVRRLAVRGRRAETASATVYRILRQEITWLKRKPGEPIIEKDIALAQSVSRTPVREALLRLAAEGLVDTVSKSGTFVARIPLSALPEAIVVRKATAIACSLFRNPGAWRASSRNTQRSSRRSRIMTPIARRRRWKDISTDCRSAWKTSGA